MVLRVSWNYNHTTDNTNTHVKHQNTHTHTHEQTEHRKLHCKHNPSNNDPNTNKQMKQQQQQQCTNITQTCAYWLTDTSKTQTGNTQLYNSSITKQKNKQFRNMYAHSSTHTPTLHRMKQRIHKNTICHITTITTNENNNNNKQTWKQWHFCICCRSKLPCV